MKYHRLAVFIGLLLALWPAGSHAQDSTRRPAAARRLALVVGNAAYPDSPLAAVRDETRAVASEFERLGFQVSLVENVTGAEMIRAARTFGSGIRPADVAVFYFAGYGVQIEGENLLMPVDARGRSIADVRRSGVRVAEVQQLLRQARSPLLIFDACRESPFAGTRPGLAPMPAARSLVVFAAAADRTIVTDVPRRHGLFNELLLNTLRQRDLSVRQVFQRVRLGVSNATAGRQNPAIFDDLAGDFVLSSAVDSSAPPPAPGAAPPASPPATPPPSGGSPRSAPPKRLPPPVEKQVPTRSPLPDFPWPPPAASEQVTLDRSLFPPGRSMSTVGDQLALALDDARYEYSYHRAPGGFAVVARLERVDASGKPMPGDARFAAPDAREQFSLASYIKQLFFAAEGYYRLIVFVATDQAFTTTGLRLRSKEAGELLARGSNRLPAEYDKLIFTNAHRVSALVYEFRKGSRDGDATHLVPGRLGALVHLERAGIYQTLLRSR
jgi:Caspase domain